MVYKLCVHKLHVHANVSEMFHMLLLLASLHELNAVSEENISVLVSKALCLICDFPSIVMDGEPSCKTNIMLSSWQLNFSQFLRAQGIV